jgi:hypothetical protein
VSLPNRLIRELGRDEQLRLLEKLECRHCGAWVAPTRLAAERYQQRCPKLVTSPTGG